jgi:hypothetical protein
MFSLIKRATRSGALGGCLLALLAGPTAASGTEVVVGRDSLDGVAHEFNICGWEATFTATGQIHWTVAMADEHNGHVTVQEAVSYVLVIDDDPNVPESLRGATWRGHNVISFVTNFDPASEREITRSVQPFWEGPFRGLSERFTMVIAADGTVRVDRQVLPSEIDCEAFGA